MELRSALLRYLKLLTVAFLVGSWVFWLCGRVDCAEAQLGPGAQPQILDNVVRVDLLAVRCGARLVWEKKEANSVQGSAQALPQGVLHHTTGRAQGKSLTGEITGTLLALRRCVWSMYCGLRTRRASSSHRLPFLKSGSSCCMFRVVHCIFRVPVEYLRVIEPSARAPVLGQLGTRACDIRSSHQGPRVAPATC